MERLSLVSVDVAQADVEIVIGLENQIRALREMRDRKCLEILDRISKGGHLEPGTHSAEVRIENYGASRVVRLIIDGRLIG